MAKERKAENRKKDEGGFRAWIKRNEKMCVVALLVVIAPLFAFTGPISTYFDSADGEFARVYGSSVSRTEAKHARDLLNAASALAPGVFGKANGFMNGPSAASRFGPRDFSVRDFLAYREKARRQGIHVSDIELTERIRDSWRRISAGEYVRAETQGLPQQVAFQQSWTLFQQRQEELIAANTFDGADWSERVRDRRVRVGDFEETLRDLCAIGKLGDYVLGDVQVSADEVLETFRSEHEERKLSWMQVDPPEALVSKFADALTDKAISDHYDNNPQEFRRPFALRAHYVKVPIDSFKADVEADVSDADLESEYKTHRNAYRRPAIVSEEATFALRTASEQEALDAKLFFPLDEVKDKARDAAVLKRAQRELDKVVGTVQGRLFDKDAPAAPKALVQDYPFLDTGWTEFTTQEEAEETFGDVYVDFLVSDWFRQAAQARARRVKIDPPQYARKLSEERGKVFFTGIETRTASVPRLRDIREQVKQALALDLAKAALFKELDRIAQEVNDTAGKELATLAGTEVEVAGPAGAKVPVAVGELETELEFSKKPVYRGVIKTASTPEDGTPSTGGDAPHTDSAELLAAAFAIDGPSQAAAARGKDACYLVRLDDRKPPAPSDFEKNASAMERKLKEDKALETFQAWRSGFYQEAFPGAGLEVAESAAGEDVAQN